VVPEVLSDLDELKGIIEGMSASKKEFSWVKALVLREIADAVIERIKGTYSCKKPLKTRRGIYAHSRYGNPPAQASRRIDPEAARWAAWRGCELPVSLRG
jgi:hypothetical protein